MKNYGKWVFVFSACLLSFSACIDNKYDMSKLPDNIIVASDSLILPIGVTDSVTAKQMIDDQNFDYLVVRDGMYYVNYSDSILLKMPLDKKVDDILENSSTRIFAYDKLVNTNITIDTDDHEVLFDSIEYEIKTGATLNRLDYIRFRQEPGMSKMNVVFKTNDIQVLSGNVSINVSLQIPKGVVLIPDVGTIKKVNGVDYYEVQDIQVKDLPITRSFRIYSYERSSAKNPVFRFRTDLYMKAGSVVKYTNVVPSYSCDMKSENMYADYVKGKVNYSATVQGLSVNLANLYKNFDPSLDRFRLYHPRLFVTSNSDAGVPLDVKLKVKSDLNTYSPIDLGVLAVSPDTGIFVDNKYMFSNNITPLEVPVGFIWKEFDMRGLINQRPKFIASELDCTVPANSGSEAVPHFMSIHSKAKVKYNLELPISFDEDFKLSYSDTLVDVLNDSRVKETFFTSGSVDITATLVSTIPLNWSVQLTILSDDPSEAPVVIPQPVLIAGSNGRAESDFRVTVTAEQMKSMNHPAHLKVEASVTSDANLKGIPIRNTDFFLVKNVRLIKKGGINIR